MAAEPPCAVLASPPPLKGTFEEFDLGDRCSAYDYLQFSLTTNATDDAPLFTTMISQGKTCIWSFATISDGRTVTLARVQENVYATKPVTADDKTYWFALDGRYYIVDESGERSANSLVPGFSVTSIGADGKGRLFAIESEKRTAFDNQMRLVDVRSGKSRALPTTGYTEDLTRTWDGNLYFRLFSNGDCSVYEVASDLSVTLKAKCPFENGHGIALSAGGGVWQPFIFGVGDYSQTTVPRGVSVYSKFRCVISNTAALEGRNVTSDPQGNVWFTYADHLWLRDVLGHVFSLKLPQHVGGVMVATRDDALWITGDSPTGRPALYRFRASSP